MLQEFDEELGREWKAFCRRADRVVNNICTYAGEQQGRSISGDNLLDYRNPKLPGIMESSGALYAEVNDNYEIVFEGDIPVPAKGVHVSKDKKSIVIPQSAKSKAFDIAKEITSIDGCAVTDFHGHPDTIHVHFVCLSRPKWSDEMVTLMDTDKFREQSNGILDVIKNTL